ncbi:MAG: hypothetical protein JL56_14160 [Desulfotomaculum sp. BICA1-6]|nr:MAG: hypothetical protein VR67_10790 [Peptococcaceae bacterium BRH_c8a]KJS71823.1 MAG: hypothetical protein JL56_14160 [Desulfotomaculum sp. BICA1-6]
MPLYKPGEAIKYGIVGCGAIAQRYVQVFGSLENACVHAVADNDADRAQDLAAKLNCTYYTDYASLLKDEQVDAVIIATPSGLHARVAIDTLGAGKHAIVEKPMALTLEQADQMLQAAQKANRILTTVLNNRFLPATRYLKQAIDNGYLGRLIYGSACVYWYRPQSYYRESGWRGTVAMDGGVLLNQAIHHIDLLLFYLGHVEDVQAYRATLGHDIEAEDTAAVTLKFANGSIGTITATTCAFPRNLEETVTVIGEKGSVILGGSKLNDFRTWQVQGMAANDALSAVHELELPKWYGHYKFIEDINLAIINGTEPMVKGVDGKMALELIQRINQASPILSRNL